MCTKNGVIKKTTLEAYSRPRQNGIIAINVREGDQLLSAKLTDGNSHILMALESGRAIHFEESKVRPMGRGASGVRGITLGHDKDQVVGMICVSNGNGDFVETSGDGNEEEVQHDEKEPTVLVVSQNGYGKRTAVGDYRITNRGGKGVKTMNITEKTGSLVGILNVTDEDNLMIINRSGIAIRLEISNIRVMGRATQGVRLINLKGNDQIASVAKIEIPEEDRALTDENEEGEESAGEVDNTPETPTED